MLQQFISWSGDAVTVHQLILTFCNILFAAPDMLQKSTNWFRHAAKVSADPDMLQLFVISESDMLQKCQLIRTCCSCLSYLIRTCCSRLSYLNRTCCSRLSYLNRTRCNSVRWSGHAATHLPMAAGILICDFGRASVKPLTASCSLFRPFVKRLINNLLQVKAVKAQMFHIFQYRNLIL
jgi:hypothetical protein